MSNGDHGHVICMPDKQTIIFSLGVSLLKTYFPFGKDMFICENVWS